MRKFKAIIKRPDEEIGHVTWVSDSLKNLQKHVEGHIQALHLTRELVLICNEDGKILGLEPNFPLPWGDVVVGMVIICGQSGEEFADIPCSRKEWAELLASFKSS